MHRVIGHVVNRRGNENGSGGVFASASKSAACALLLALPVLACSSKSSGPSTWTYSLDFGSVASAVSIDAVDVNVYDGTLPAARCADLVQARRTKADLPKPLVTISSTPCDLSKGAGQVAIPYGTYSVLVVGHRQGQDWLIGCNTQYVTASEDPGTLPIELTIFSDAVLVAPTTCQTLTDHCNGAC